MSLSSLAEWLRCPNCFNPLNANQGRVLSCSEGHSFDVNKRGFVNLLSGRNKFIGDSAAMLDAREAFLAAGWFDPVRRSIAALMAAAAPQRVVDVGCGTGYYLNAALGAESDIRALGVDLSVQAVSRTVRTHAHIDGVVADVWSPLPLRDAVADVVLNVFAPRNASEFYRVLRPGGLLIVVIPQREHLAQLRASGKAVAIHTDKSSNVQTSLDSGFALEEHQQLAYTEDLSTAEVGDLLAMGPSAHHSPSVDESTTSANHQVTFAFEVLSFRRRASPLPG